MTRSRIMMRVRALFLLVVVLFAFVLAVSPILVSIGRAIR